MNQCIDCGGQIVGLHICPTPLSLKPPGVIIRPDDCSALVAENAKLREECDVWKEKFERQGDKLDKSLLQNSEMIPVVQAAVNFWKSDKGDTEAEAALYAAVEGFEAKESNDVFLWACALKRDLPVQMPCGCTCHISGAYCSSCKHG